MFFLNTFMSLVFFTQCGKIMACRLFGAKPIVHIVSWTPWNNFQWNFNQNTKIFKPENLFENVVCKMAAILSRPRCVNKSVMHVTHTLQGFLCTLRITSIIVLGHCNGWNDLSDVTLSCWIFYRKIEYMCICIVYHSHTDMADNWNISSREAITYLFNAMTVEWCMPPTVKLTINNCKENTMIQCCTKMPREWNKTVDTVFKINESIIRHRFR